MSDAPANGQHSVGCKAASSIALDHQVVRCITVSGRAAIDPNAKSTIDSAATQLKATTLSRELRDIAAQLIARRSQPRELGGRGQHPHGKPDRHPGGQYRDPDAPRRDP